VLRACFRSTSGPHQAKSRCGRTINWGNDPFARGAYSYATPRIREAQSVLRKPKGDAIFFSGDALYAGPDMGTVEAALASGQETAQTILIGAPATPPRA
jgi:Flavin containing amine oxidoreductase